jgi:hypothetical protein
MPRESLSAVPPTTDPLQTAQSTMSNSGGVADGDTNASVTEQPLRSTVEPTTSTPVDGLQASTTDALPSSCVCTC